MSQPFHQPPPAPQAAQPRWGRFVMWTAAAAAAAFAICGGVAVLMDDGESGGDSLGATACKDALAENYRKAMAHPGGPTQAPPIACLGLDQATLQRITNEMVSEYLESDQADEDVRRLLEQGLQSATAQP